MPPCSVIIPVFNKASLTRQCLDSILDARAEKTKFEVIVADDASTDATPEMLGEYGERIQVVRHAVNQGYARSCNDAAAIATGDWLVLLNNDTIALPGWLDALVEYGQSRPHVAAVGSKLLFPNNTIQHAGMVVCQDRFLRHIYVGFPADHPAVSKSRRFTAVTAACMLVRRSIFHEMGGFDTAFLNGYEDTDFCLRLNERGHEIHYCHESVLYHLECATRDSASEQEHVNERLYFSRWGHKVTPDDFLYYMEDGLLQVSYPATYPLVVTLAAELAVVANDPSRRADRLLEQRAKQVYDLLKENVRLSVRASESSASIHGRNGTARTGN
jgi:GT2 family glycosyltransferase